MTLVLAFAAVLGLAMLTLIWLGQRRLIYFPDSSPPSLERAGLAGAEAVMFATATDYASVPGLSRDRARRPVPLCLCSAVTLAIVVIARHWLLRFARTGSMCC